ncbi:MAG: dihydrolipoyl dehydrogenase [Candidatus Hydrogenedentes bacterium]|nr:dihydrolipoyl dehydrogenase [Candidatus Hydrogenedentota bacterium]
MHECDVAVIGAGPGGYVAAVRAAQRGAKTLVIEHKELGGVCLNWGCIPTKTLIHTAELYRKLQHADEFGLNVDGVRVDLKALLAWKDEVIKRNKSGIQGLFKAHGIEVIRGRAQVTAPGVIAVGKDEVRAKAIIIATGSAPAQLPGLETDGKKIITSTEALELDKLPGRIAVIGGGPLGAEFACLWNALGVEVDLIEMMPTLLPLADEELTKRLAAILKRRGMHVHTGTAVEALKKTKKGVSVALKDSKAEPLDVDLVLVGIGCKYNSEAVTETPGLGVEVGPRGAILVNERMETNVPGIFAVGDVVGKTMLAHGASAEGVVAAENATGANKTIDYRVVPSCTFTAPEVATVGLTEKAAREAGIDVKIGRFPFKASGRAQAMGETEGMVKIVGDAATDEVVGVHIMGPEAGELIAAGALAIQMEATVEEIADTIHTHPTLSETMKEAAEDYFGLSIHTPPRTK